MASYADRSRQRPRSKLEAPRNMRAAQQANQQGVPLVVSFVGDSPWQSPVIYCDGGVRYDWSWIPEMVKHTVIVTRPAIDIRHAAAAILGLTDTLLIGYPILVDVESKEVACVIESMHGFLLWQVRRGTELWQQYFEPAQK